MALAMTLWVWEASMYACAGVKCKKPPTEDLKYQCSRLVSCVLVLCVVYSMCKAAINLEGKSGPAIYSMHFMQTTVQTADL